MTWTLVLQLGVLIGWTGIITGAMAGSIIQDYFKGKGGL